MLFVYGFSEDWEVCGVDVETTVTIIVAEMSQSGHAANCCEHVVPRKSEVLCFVFLFGFFGFCFCLFFFFLALTYFCCCRLTHIHTYIKAHSFFHVYRIPCCNLSGWKYVFKPEGKKVYCANSSIKDN